MDLTRLAEKMKIKSNSDKGRHQGTVLPTQHLLLLAAYSQMVQCGHEASSIASLPYEVVCLFPTDRISSMSAFEKSVPRIEERLAKTIRLPRSDLLLTPSLRFTSWTCNLQERTLTASIASAQPEPVAGPPLMDGWLRSGSWQPLQTQRLGGWVLRRILILSANETPLRDWSPPTVAQNLKATQLHSLYGACVS